MTIENETRQRFLVSPETYWRELCLSLEYQRRLYCEVLGCTRMDIVSHEGDYERGMKRRLRFEKPLDAPTAIKKLFGESVVIEEVSEFDPKTQRWSFAILPAVLTDRMDIRGSLRLAPLEQGVEQVSVNSVSCRLFGVGSIVEHFVAKSTADGIADKTKFTERYIDEKNLRLR